MSYSYIFSLYGILYGLLYGFVNLTQIALYVNTLIGESVFFTFGTVPASALLSACITILTYFLISQYAPVR